MVEVFSRDGIESKKKAATCHPTDNMQDCNLVWSEQFSTRQSHHSKYLPKRTSSYPAFPPRLNQVLMGKSTTPLEIRCYQPQHLRVSRCSSPCSSKYWSNNRFIKCLGHTYELTFQRMEVEPGWELQVDFAAGCPCKTNTGTFERIITNSLYLHERPARGHPSRLLAYPTVNGGIKKKEL